MSTPGVSTGTMIIDDPWYGWTSGFVTAITIRKSATDPFDVNHLWPLMTHSSPSRTRRRPQQRRVRSRRVRLGHRERRAQLAVEQRLQPLLPHRLVARLLDTHRQQLRVPRVGCVVAEHHRPQRRLPQDLVHQPQLHLPEAHAARAPAAGAPPTAPRPSPAPAAAGSPRAPGRTSGPASRAGTPPRGRSRASTRASPRTPARSRNPRPSGLLLPARRVVSAVGGPHPATTVGAVTTTPCRLPLPAPSTRLRPTIRAARRPRPRSP